ADTVRPTRAPRRDHHRPHRRSGVRPGAGTQPRPGVIDVLQVRSLSYAVSTARLIDDASFAVPSGGLIALVGPNGAGKSTLLRLLSVTLPAAGTYRRRADGPAVLLDGTDLLALRRHERARRVALVEQHNHAEFSLTARQAVELGRIPHESRWGIGSDRSEERRVGKEAVSAG